MKSGFLFLFLSVFILKEHTIQKMLTSAEQLAPHNFFEPNQNDADGINGSKTFSYWGFSQFDVDISVKEQI